MIGILPSLIVRHGWDLDPDLGGLGDPYSTVMEAAKDIPFSLAWNGLCSCELLSDGCLNIALEFNHTSSLKSQKPSRVGDLVDLCCLSGLYYPVPRFRQNGKSLTDKKYGNDEEESKFPRLLLACKLKKGFKNTPKP
jgi:hypothetical protein